MNVRSVVVVGSPLIYSALRGAFPRAALARKHA